MKNRLMYGNKKYEEEKFVVQHWSTDEKPAQPNSLVDDMSCANNYKTPDKVPEYNSEESSYKETSNAKCPPSSYVTSPSKLLETITEQPSKCEMDNTLNMKSDESSSRHKSGRSEEFNDYFKTPADSKTKFISPSKIKLTDESKVDKIYLDSDSSIHKPGSSQNISKSPKIEYTNDDNKITPVVPNRHVSSFIKYQSESKSSVESRSTSQKQNEDVGDLKVFSPSPSTDKFEKRSIKDIPSTPLKILEHISSQDSGSTKRYIGKQNKCNKWTEKV